MRSSIKLYRYKSLGITSTEVPGNIHDMVHVTYGGNDYFLMIDPNDDTQLLISDDYAETWEDENFDTGDFTNGVLSRTYHITSIWYDRSNNLVYFIDLELADDNSVYAWYLDLSDMSENNIGGAITDDYTLGDIYIRDGNIEVLLGTDPTVYRWSGAAWVQKVVAGDDVTTISYAFVKDATHVYFYGDDVDNELQVFLYNGDAAITAKDSQAGYGLPSESLRGISYDGNDTLYFIATKDADGNNPYLMKYGITANVIAEVEALDAALMLDRNCIGTVPNVNEKAIDSTNELVYEIKNGGKGLVLLQDMSVASDAALSWVSDSYLMNSDGDLWEFIDVSAYLSSITHQNGIIGVLNVIDIILHPDYEGYFKEGDSFKYYDVNDVFGFWGKIISKSRDSDGIYIVHAESFTNEIYKTTYEKTYSADDLDTKQKDIIDNGCNFCYRSSSIVGTTTTFNYTYNRKIAYMFYQGRFLERQVPYIDPDGIVWTKAYDGLTATGQSWDLADGDENKRFMNIPYIEETFPGYYKGKLNITRATVRYKNNITTIRPTTYAAAEQQYGVIPLEEWVDPAIEASTEAQQLGDNLYNIFNPEIEFLCLYVTGKGFLQPGKTITIVNTGQITIASQAFLILQWKYDPKHDRYLSMVLCDSIIFPQEFKSYNDTLQSQLHQSSIQTLENQSFFNAFNAIGSANAQWLTVTHGFTNKVAWDFDSGSNRFLRNRSANDFIIMCPISLSTNKGSLKLYISDVRLGIVDADAGDCVDNLYILGYTAYDTLDTIYTWTGDANSAKEWVLSTDDGAWAGPYDCSGSKHVMLKIDITATDDADLEFTYIDVEYYYDT